MTNFHEGIFFLEKSILFEKYALGNKRLGWFSEIITQTGIYHFCPIFESKIFVKILFTISAKEMFKFIIFCYQFLSTQILFVCA